MLAISVNLWYTGDMWGLKYYYMEIAFPTNTIEYERIWHSFDTAPVSMRGGNMWLFWIQIKPKSYWEFPAHDRKVVERQRHEIMQDVLKTGELENLVGGLEHVSLSPIVGMMIQSDFHIFQGVGIPPTRNGNRTHTLGSLHKWSGHLK